LQSDVWDGTVQKESPFQQPSVNFPDHIFKANMNGRVKEVLFQSQYQ